MSRRVRALTGHSYPWTDIDPEQRNALLLVGGIAVIVLFALALIAYGYYHDRIQPKHATVLQVGDRKFSYAYLERRTRLAVRRGQADASNPPQAVVQTLSQLESEELTRQAAKTKGVTATAEEVDARIREKLGIPGEASRDTLAARLRIEIVSTGLDLPEYREIAQTEVLNKKLHSEFEAAVPAETDHVDLLVIETDARDKAQEALQRILKGDSFQVVAAQMSTHASKTKGGELGLVPRGALPSEIENVAFNLAGLSDIVELRNSFYLLLTRGKEVKPVDSDERAQIVGQSLNALLQKTRDDLGSEPKLTSAQLQRIARSVARPALPGQPAPASQPIQPIQPPVPAGQPGQPGG